MSDTGCVRTNNEDCCLAEPQLGLFVVADGMGGARAGERASRIAVDAVLPPRCLACGATVGEPAAASSSPLPANAAAQTAVPAAWAATEADAERMRAREPGMTNRLEQLRAQILKRSVSGAGLKS